MGLYLPSNLKLNISNLQLSRDLHSSIVQGRFPQYVCISFYWLQLFSSPFLHLYTSASNDNFLLVGKLLVSKLNWLVLTYLLHIWFLCRFVCQFLQKMVSLLLISLKSICVVTYFGDWDTHWLSRFNLFYFTIQLKVTSNYLSFNKVEVKGCGLPI